ncbi:MAG: UDP-N-acetylmuramoylalanine--D-glutamate ligase [Actinobacteria bacterium 13_1_20CM_2_65_11]|nr:MAG: UDP-N-acetylmuramoylalanine--D-glutamate ligase [Chloroflexi bacterium 13_1_40CM_3_65_12]OLE79968.1 MAG: UDP-N-acetylmuramoylalanine--D-glutamate ligase [Actinobacteria bacterium 13_1_20CM_2_65_11]
MTAVVVGAARSGVALANYLVDSGERVRVVDRKSEPELQDELTHLPPSVELRLGGYDDSVLAGADVVYASPGVPWDSQLLNDARRLGIKVSSEIDLFLRLCPGTVVGITGTNGKTTTTALTGTVLAAGDRPVLVGGNIGDTVLDRLDEVTPRHWVVLELSSFQLESVEEPRLHVGVILNISPDHLDRHGTFERYTDLKARAIEFAGADDFAVLNGRDQAVRRLASRTRARVVWFDEHRPVPPMPLPGRHNLENALAAAAVGRIAGLSDEAIDTAIRTFKGVEHRLELVGEWDGVRWYNDSKATNPDAGRVALSAFPDTPLVLIAGGYGSGFELGPWVADVIRHADAVVLMGASADLLAKELADHPKVVRAGDLEEAVSLASGLARPGGVVLLSPAYKSFDMFKDYEDRGRRFKAAVRTRFET